MGLSMRPFRLIGNDMVFGNFFAQQKLALFAKEEVIGRKWSLWPSLNKRDKVKCC
jgi:hypothetical protein